MRLLAALLVLAGVFLSWVAVVEGQEEVVGFGVLMVAGGLALWSRSKEERPTGPTPAELAQRIEQLERRLSAAEQELGLLTPEIQRLKDEREFLRALYAGVSEKSRA